MKKLIESRKDIKLIDIPIHRQDSFRTFMFGQSYSIDREIKINNILYERTR